MRGTWKFWKKSNNIATCWVTFGTQYVAPLQFVYELWNFLSGRGKKFMSFCRGNVGGVKKLKKFPKVRQSLYSNPAQVLILHSALIKGCGFLNPTVSKNHRAFSTRNYPGSLRGKNLKKMSKILPSFLFPTPVVRGSPAVYTVANAHRITTANPYLPGATSQRKSLN